MTSLAFSQTVSRDFTAAFEVGGAVIRDFGTGGSPWSSDFSADFGPLATTGFGADHNITVIRDFVIAAEIRSVAATIANATMPIEWTSTFVGTPSTAPVEYRSSLLGSPLAPIDWRSGVSVDATMSSANGLLVAAPYSFPSESRQTTVVAASVPAEWRSPVAGDVLAPAASGLTVRADVGPISVETASTALLGAPVPVQFLPTILRDDVLNFESGLVPPAVSGNAQMSLEWRSEVAVDRVFPTAAGVALSRDIATPGEWTGGAASFDDATMTIEFGMGRATTNTIPVEVVSSVLSEPEVVAIADASAITEFTPVSEYTLSVLGEDFLFPIANERLIGKDYTAPTEWSSISVTANVSFSIEWPQSFKSDLTDQIDWTSNISADTQALIETSVTTQSQSMNAEVPVEWRMTIAVDVVINSERWFERDSIGSSLEPDEWERTHG